MRLIKSILIVAGGVILIALAALGILLIAASQVVQGLADFPDALKTVEEFFERQGIPSSTLLVFGAILLLSVAVVATPLISWLWRKLSGPTPREMDTPHGDYLRDQSRKIMTGGGPYIEGDQVIYSIQGEVRLPGPEAVRRYLQAVCETHTYARWRDERYVGGEAIPMRVARYAAPPDAAPERVDLLEAITDAKHNVILGEPGIGKTTALERLMWVTATKSLADASDLVPVFVSLSLFDPQVGFSPLVRAGLNSVCGPNGESVLNLDDGALEAWLHDKETHPRLWLLLDGLNEVSPELQARLLNAIRVYESDYPAHCITLTCRTADWGGELPWETWEVQELVDADVPDYLYAHLGEAAGRALYYRLHRDERLKSMARVPLLLYMISRAGAGGELPTDRGALVRSFVHDAKTLGRVPARWQLKAEATLGAFASRLHAQRQLVAPLEPDLFDVIETARGARGYTPEQMWDWLRGTGLLVPAGDHVRFLHQLVQEYFAAEALLEAPDPLAAVREKASDPWWRETVILALWLDERLRAPDALITVMTDAELDLRVRAEAGRILAHVGDPRPGVGLRADGLPDLDWVDVPGGEVTLEDVVPTFRVKPFQIARYPITNRQYQAFIDDGGYADARWWGGLTAPENVREPAEPGWAYANHPRETASWYEAVAYCRWLTAKLRETGGLEEDTVVRLPTEMEWQQAATGGDPAHKYPWGPEWDASLANTRESGMHTTTAVGMYPLGATAQGAQDMAGNVWEWCLNVYDDPAHVGEGGEAARVLRGGAWVGHQRDARAVARGRHYPVLRDRGGGFRVVCARPPSP